MDAKQRAELKARIEAMMAESQEVLLDQQAAQQAIAPDSAIGRISRMDAMYTQQLTNASLQRAKQRLAKLEFVLGQLDAPEFGRCLYCQPPEALEKGKQSQG